MGDLEEGEVREDIMCQTQISSANRELVEVDERLYKHIIQLRQKQVELITLNKRILDDLHQLKEGAPSKKKWDTEVLKDEIGTSLPSFAQEFERKSAELDRLYNFVEESSLLMERRKIKLWKLMKDHDRAVGLNQWLELQDQSLSETNKIRSGDNMTSSNYLLHSNHLRFQAFSKPTLHEEIDAGSVLGTETTSEEH